MVARSAVRAFVVGEQRLVAALGARLDPVADKILLSELNRFAVSVASGSLQSTERPRLLEALE